jgi:hypothetical protein
MVEVQDKHSGLAHQRLSTGLTVQRGGSGSVPAVLPNLLPSRSPVGSSLNSDIASLLLIVVVPTGFWCALFCGVRSLIGLDTSVAALTLVGLVISAFLLIIRASLAMDRSA